MSGVESGRLRIAFLSQNTIVPLDSGGRIRNYHLLRAMAARHDVHVLLTEARLDDAHLLDDLGVVVHHVPKPWWRYATYFRLLLKGVPLAVAVQVNPGLSSWLRDADVDVVVCGTSARAVELRRGGWTGPVVIDTQNLEFVRLPRVARSQLTLWARATGLVRALGIERFERAVFAGSTVVVCSEEEAALIRGWDTCSVGVIENGVDLDRFPRRPSPEGRPTVVFTGDLAYSPNVAAARILGEQLAPALLRARPDLRIVAAGRGASTDLRRRLMAAGVEVRSPVVRMESVLAEAHAMVVPLTSGGGTRLKIIEAFAAGVPVVSTTVGAEGIAADRATEILIEDQPEEMVTALLDLVGDPQKRESFAIAGRRLAERRFGWDALGARFTDLVESAPHADLAETREGSLTA